jgi:mannose-6-phosphate isomerase-like protein (cupin superfamily)
MMEAIWFLDTLVRVHARGEETDGRYGLAECIAPPGHQPPPHVHHRDDEAFYVIDGELTVYIADTAVTLAPGEFLNAPRGVPHTFCVTSEDPARWLVWSSPAGFESFVREYGEPAAVEELPVLDGPPDVERLVRVAASHAIEILGPPGMLPADLPLVAA